MCARRTVFCLPPPALSSRFPAVSSLLVPNMPWKRKKCWTADAWCRLDSVRKRTSSRISRGSPTATSNPAKKTDRRAQPVRRGLSQSAARLQGNPQSRADWLCLRGVAETECAILPVRELAAFHRCSACEYLRAGERPPARRSRPAPVFFGEFSWQPDPVPWSGSLGGADGPCSRRTDSIHDSGSDRWKLRREADGEWSQSTASAECLPLILSCALPLCERV